MTTALAPESVLSEIQRLLATLENLCAQMANAPDVVIIPTAHRDMRSLRDLRLDRQWPQTEVVARLRQVATEPLPDDLLNQYKRWERGKNVPSQFYARLLCVVFGVGDIAFRRPARRVADTAPLQLASQAAA